MISSSIFSGNATLENIQQLKADLVDNEVMINRSILYHTLLAFASSINEDESLILVEKYQVVGQFGFQLGKNVTEEESYGNIKYFLPKSEKDKTKPFIGQFKFLNGKLWPCIFGSTAKLFAILPSGGDSGGYKIDDKDFGLIKWISGDQAKARNLRKLLLEMTKSVIEGMLDKFDLIGEVTYKEISENEVNFEVKNLDRKQKAASK